MPKTETAKRKTEKLPAVSYHVQPANSKAAFMASWQAPFPKTVKCEKCGGEARAALTLMEDRSRAMMPAGYDFVCRLHPNEEHGAWPHDAIAFALYFCRECYHGQVEWNQA